MYYYMKLAVFTDQFPSRSQTFVINQIVGLLEQGVDITVLSLSSEHDNSVRELNVIHPELADRTIYLLNENSATRFGKLLSRAIPVFKSLFNRKKRTRVIHALGSRFGHHGKSLLLASIASKYQQPLQFDAILCHFGYNGIVANKLRELDIISGKVATIFHGFDISAQSALRRYKKDYQQLFSQTELMLPISELWKSKLIELGCSKDKISVHRMGVDLNVFKYRVTIQPNHNRTKDRVEEFKLFTVARFSKKKGLAYAIKALALLPKDIKYHYYLGGFGELEEELQQLVIELKLDKKVTFLGSLNQQQVKEYMHYADVFVQPSITAENGDMEGVPVAIMEAMAIGIPVLSTVHSGIPELISHDKHGLLAHERDAKGLAENIEQLYRDIKLVDKLRINARKKIEDISDVDKLNNQLMNILTSIVEA